MICGDDFISSSLEIPVIADDDGVFCSSKNLTSVSYSTDNVNNIWLKTVSLDKLDRSELSSLLAFLKRLQYISPFRILSDVPSFSQLSQHPQSYNGFNLPCAIYLREVELNIAYSLCDSGSAGDILHSYPCNSIFSEPFIGSIIARCIKSLNSIHKQGWLHRAICAKHILLSSTRNDDTNSELDVSFCGLGGITPIHPPGSPLNRIDLPCLEFSWRGWHYQNYFNPNQGALPLAWYSPEQLAQDFTGYNTPSDIFSLGLTIGELFSGVPPYIGVTSPAVIFLKKLCVQEKFGLTHNVSYGDYTSCK